MATSSEKRLIHGKAENKRRRERPARTWFQDYKRLDMADASKLVTDLERWRQLIRVTTGQIASPDYIAR